MKMRYLGNTGLKVSEICFGTLTFGKKEKFKETGEQNVEEAARLVNMAVDAGVNFFDTADVYADGRSEEILGKALGDKRNDVILATKVRGTMGPGPNDVGLSRHHIMEGCEDSLRRLGTDYIDLYQVHSFDPGTPHEETLRALDDLVRQGKVRYAGCSNYAAWRLMKALSVSERKNLESFVSLQAHYSLLSRDLEFELVPLCIEEGLGILVWSPLSMGFLTGKYRRDEPLPDNTRLDDPGKGFLPFDTDKGYDIVEELDKIAGNHGASVPQAALNYLLHKPGVTSLIIGARTPEHLEDNLKCVEWKMTDDERERLDELSTPPKIYLYWMISDSER